MPKEYDPNDVSCPVPDYEFYMALLELPHTLLGGTPAMRDAGKQYLPQEDAETPENYKSRLHRSFLLNEFDNTIDKLSGEVFSTPVMLPDEMAEDVKVWCGDVDLSGNNLNRFAASVFEAGLVDGVVHILVDMPQINTNVSESGQVQFQNAETGEFEPLTIEAANDNGWRPYFVLIKAEQVIGWRHEKIGNQNVLAQVRIKEIIEQPSGQYGVEMVERIRVIEPGRYEIWELQEVENEKEQWILIEEGPTGWNFVPLITWIIGDPLSQMTCKPPLDDLAYLNLAHWQSSSDQRNVLHYARMITYFGKMLDIEADKKQRAVLGANVLVHSDQPEADLKVVEHSGAAIEAGRNDLKDLELQMRQYGLGLMTDQRPGNVTATETAIETAETDSQLKSWAITFQDMMNQAFRVAAQMMQMDEDAIAEGVRVNTDFKSFLRSMEIRELREAYNDGLLPQEIVIEEFKRRGVIREDLDFAEIVMMLEQERNGVLTNND